jgi:hypothetical protein
MNRKQRRVAKSKAGKHTQTVTKAEKLMREANQARDIANFLKRNGLRSLSDLLPK